MFENKVKTGEVLDSTVYFRDFAKRWMEEYTKPRLAPKTFQRYHDYLKRIIPAIGHIKLAKLWPMHLNAFYKNLAEPGINRQGKRDKNGNLLEQKLLAPKTLPRALPSDSKNTKYGRSLGVTKSQRSRANRSS